MISTVSLLSVALARPWMDASDPPAARAAKLVKAMNLIVVDCLNQDGERGSFAIDPEGRVIPLHAAQNQLTVLPVRGQTPWTRSKPDSIESFAAELLRRIKSGRELSAKLAAASGTTSTSEEEALAAQRLAQAAGHQAQMAAQGTDGEHAPCSFVATCECEDGCSSDGEGSEPLPAKLAQQMLERDEHVLSQLAPGRWGPAAKAAGLVQSVGSQTEDLGAPGRVLAKRQGHVVLSTRATHELAHASVDRTLQSLRIGGARVVSSDGTVHQGDKITAADVSWQRKCPHCAQYKTVNRSVDRGHSVRGVAGEALAPGGPGRGEAGVGVPRSGGLLGPGPRGCYLFPRRRNACDLCRFREARRRSSGGCLCDGVGRGAREASGGTSSWPGRANGAPEHFCVGCLLRDCHVRNFVSFND